MTQTETTASVEQKPIDWYVVMAMMSSALIGFAAALTFWTATLFGFKYPLSIIHLVDIPFRFQMAATAGIYFIVGTATLLYVSHAKRETNN